MLSIMNGVAGHAAAGAETTILETLSAGAIGDSIAEQMFTQFGGAGESAFESEAANYFTVSSDLYDSAASGSFLLRGSALDANPLNTNLFWVDDSAALSAGAQFTNNITNDANTPNAYICCLGINDNPHITATGTTVNDVENAFNFIANEATANTPFVMLNSLGRDAGGDDAGCNILREGIVNAIQNSPAIKRGIDIYDLERTNNKHLSQAGNEAKGLREARQVSHYLGNTPAQAMGPAVTSAILKTDEIELTFAHVGGSDITAPLSGNGGMDASNDGAAMGANSLTRIDATTAKLTFPEGTAPIAGSEIKLYVPYGKDGGLAATPDVMKDNSALALPVQSDIITVSNGDPIQALDNLAIYWDARGSVKTFSAGSDVSSIAALAGISTANAIGTGNEPTFTNDHLAFSATDQLQWGAFPISETHSFIFVFDIPGSVNSGNVFAFGTPSGATDNQARAVTAGTDELFWTQGADGSSKKISNVLAPDTKYFALFEFAAGDQLNVYWSQVDTPNFTIDPRNDYYDDGTFNGWAHASLGARFGQSDALLARYHMAAHTTDVLSASEKAGVFNYLNARFTLGL